MVSQRYHHRLPCRTSPVSFQVSAVHKACNKHQAFHILKIRCCKSHWKRSWNFSKLEDGCSRRKRHWRAWSKISSRLQRLTILFAASVEKDWKQGGTLYWPHLHPIYVPEAHWCQHAATAWSCSAELCMHALVCQYSVCGLCNALGLWHSHMSANTAIWLRPRLEDLEIQTQLLQTGPRTASPWTLSCRHVRTVSLNWTKQSQT